MTSICLVVFSYISLRALFIPSLYDSNNCIIIELGSFSFQLHLKHPLFWGRGSGWRHDVLVFVVFLCWPLATWLFIALAVCSLKLHLRLGLAVSCLEWSSGWRERPGVSDVATLGWVFLKAECGCRFLEWQGHQHKCLEGLGMGILGHSWGCTGTSGGSFRDLGVGECLPQVAIMGDLVPHKAADLQLTGLSDTVLLELRLVWALPSWIRMILLSTRSTQGEQENHYLGCCPQGSRIWCLAAGAEGTWILGAFTL